MIAMNLVLDGQGAFADLTGKKLHHVTAAITVTCLRGGMASGKPSVALRLNLEDGSVVLAETSLALFLTAADAFRGKYGDPR